MSCLCAAFAFAFSNVCVGAGPCLSECCLPKEVCASIPSRHHRSCRLAASDRSVVLAEVPGEILKDAASSPLPVVLQVWIRRCGAFHLWLGPLCDHEQRRQEGGMRHSGARATSLRGGGARDRGTGAMGSGTGSFAHHHLERSLIPVRKGTRKRGFALVEIPET